MIAPEIVDQELVIHLFAPLDGPRADAAYAELNQIWLRCRRLFGMVDQIPGIGLSNRLPLQRPRITVDPDAQEFALAAQERGGAACQAIVRVHHDVLNLSVALTHTGRAADARPGWVELDRLWSEVAGPWSGAFLGGVKIFQGKPLAGNPTADDRLGHVARPLLPAEPEADGWWEEGVTLHGNLAVWETGPRRETRAERLLLVLAPGGNDAELSAWTWSRGDVAIPPLARYLLHAAKVRYQLRVWIAAAQPEGVSHDVAPGLDNWKIRRLRRAVEIAQTNMRIPLGSDATTLLNGSGPFADDARLAEWFRIRLDDELFDLDETEAQARTLSDRLGGMMRHPVVAETPSRDSVEAARSGRAALTSADISRRVFVLRGRDSEVYRKMKEFLRQLDLAVLEWEHCVKATGRTTPSVSDIILAGVTGAQATLVLLTPDDIVRGHPAVDAPMADAPALQAPPDTLVQLGIAWALYPDRTIIVRAGEVRMPPGLAGLDPVDLDDSPACHQRIVNRLMVADCAIRQAGTDWLQPNIFAGLNAYNRRPK